MSNLTACIITLNEEDNIERCLRSVKPIANEIVVIDSGSTDKTIEIAKRFGAKVHKRRFDNYANQKNFAISKATNEWILSLDADEEIPSTLQEEIKKAVQQNQFDGFLIPRRNIIFGKEIRYTRWSPDKHIWLWKKEAGEWKGSIHEEVEIMGRVGELKNAKIHHSHKNVTEFINMLNSYTSLEAANLVKQGQKFSSLGAVYDIKKSFIGRYILKLGFLDGWRGFMLSYLRSIYKLVTWVKVWEKSNL